MTAGFLRTHGDIIRQFLRFVGIGFLNTAVDIALFNSLIAATGITVGGMLSFLTVISFTVAVVHSYIWNKFWAFSATARSVQQFLAQLVGAGFLGLIVVLAAIFGARSQYGLIYFIILIVVLLLGELMLWRSFGLAWSALRTSEGQKIAVFTAVSIGGAVINAVIVGTMTAYIDPLLGFSPELWANVAKVLATGLSLIWNFIGYKLFVFKK